MENMSGRVGVGYDDVAAAADEIVSTGERPTVRAIRDRLKTGSMGTIQRHLAVWHEKRRENQADAVHLSPEIQRAILSEIEKRVVESRLSLEKEIEDLRDDRDVLVEENDGLQKMIEELSSRLSELDGKLSRSSGIIDELRSELAASKTQINDERQGAQKAREDLAGTQAELLRLPILEKMASDLRIEIDCERTRSYKALQEAAVLEQKNNGLEARISDYTRRIEDEKKGAEKSLQLEKTAARAEEREKWLTEIDLLRREMAKSEREGMEREKTLRDKIFELEGSLKNRG